MFPHLTKTFKERKHPLPTGWPLPPIMGDEVSWGLPALLRPGERPPSALRVAEQKDRGPEFSVTRLGRCARQSWRGPPPGGTA